MIRHTLINNLYPNINHWKNNDYISNYMRLVQQNINDSLKYKKNSNESTKKLHFGRLHLYI